MTKIILGTNGDALIDALRTYYRTGVVNAIYKGKMIFASEATVTTCTTQEIYPGMPIDAIGVNRCNLATIGGVQYLLREQLYSDAYTEFWATAEHLNIYPKKSIDELVISKKTIKRFNAFSAWEEDNPIELSHTGTTDVTTYFTDASTILNKILDPTYSEHTELMRKGLLWAKQRESIR